MSSLQSSYKFRTLEHGRGRNWTHILWSWPWVLSCCDLPESRELRQWGVLSLPWSLQPWPQTLAVFFFCLLSQLWKNELKQFILSAYLNSCPNASAVICEVREAGAHRPSADCGPHQGVGSLRGPVFLLQLPLDIFNLLFLLYNFVLVLELPFPWLYVEKHSKTEPLHFTTAAELG